MIAGADTVIITASWTYAVLCNYPKTQRKLQAEVDAFIKKHGRVPEFEDRLELPYYIAVQKECIRYRPTLYFIIPRTSNQNGKLSYFCRRYKSRLNLLFFFFSYLQKLRYSKRHHNG